MKSVKFWSTVKALQSLNRYLLIINIHCFHLLEYDAVCDGITEAAGKLKLFPRSGQNTPECKWIWNRSLSYYTAILYHFVFIKVAFKRIHGVFPAINSYDCREVNVIKLCIILKRLHVAPIFYCEFDIISLQKVM